MLYQSLKGEKMGIGFYCSQSRSINGLVDSFVDITIS